jgi:hypothetical protein
VIVRSVTKLNGFNLTRVSGGGQLVATPDYRKGCEGFVAKAGRCFYLFQQHNIDDMEM